MENEQFLGSFLEAMENEECSGSFMNKYSNCLLSTSAWVDIGTYTCETKEILSLSLRAKLLYGKHSLEDLVSDGSFGSTEQIIETLKICDEKGFLVIDRANVRKVEPKKKVKKFSDKIFQNVKSWLSK